MARIGTAHEAKTIARFEIPVAETWIVDITWNGVVERWAIVVHEDPAHDTAVSPKGVVHTASAIEVATGKLCPLGVVIDHIVASA